MRLLALVYGVVSYAIFFATFLYAIGFVGNILVPKSLDSGAETGLVSALIVNLVLLTIFALQHSIMARPGFKKAWTKLVPEPVERSTYVLFSSAALILLFAYWQPLGGTIWEVSNPTGVAVLYGLFGFGWALVLISTFLINHFDLFGLRQVWLYFRNTKYTDLPFGTPGPYKLIRHPLYLGWLFAFWCTPTMTVAHLLFAVVTTAYILVAIQFEEKDLKKFLGQAYVDYCKSVPMIIPFTKKKESSLDDSQTV
ncbi:MAG: isoprenylcysteine carboxylmethyltransferase family protein [Gammaproteobacteria bacterium]|jgi:protein-S-isoprenylcysteine O-methyltransferase Ste14|nr:isoprenylcysteine carboxylmethyltransferase family protein [Gammaproteobacteria bacterium]|tara:strand:+ start:912 stop:1670 length:759 start_codon:yes stop_codon:yes gene_type:complete